MKLGEYLTISRSEDDERVFVLGLFYHIPKNQTEKHKKHHLCSPHAHFSYNHEMKIHFFADSLPADDCLKN